MIRLHWTLFAICALMILVVPTVYRLGSETKYRWPILGGWFLLLMVVAGISTYVRRSLVNTARPGDAMAQTELASQAPNLMGTLLVGFSAFVVGAFILIVVGAALWAIIQAIFYKKPTLKEPNPKATELRVPMAPSALKRYGVQSGVGRG
jgi:hypothetical protein